MTQTPAGWFPDPETPGLLRYWDGAGWTAHTQPGGVAATLPNADGAVASLILGIMSVATACTFFTGIPAIVLGRKAIKTVDASPGSYGGRGLAQAGFVTGLIGTVIGGIALLTVVLVFAFGSSVSSGFEENCRVINSDGTSSPC